MDLNPWDSRIDAFYRDTFVEDEPARTDAALTNGRDDAAYPTY